MALDRQPLDFRQGVPSVARAQLRSKSPKPRTRLVVARRIGMPIQIIIVLTPTALPTTISTNSIRRSEKLQIR